MTEVARGTLRRWVREGRVETALVSGRKRVSTARRQRASQHAPHSRRAPPLAPRPVPYYRPAGQRDDRTLPCAKVPLVCPRGRRVVQTVIKAVALVLAIIAVPVLATAIVASYILGLIALLTT